MKSFEILNFCVNRNLKKKVPNPAEGNCCEQGRNAIRAAVFSPK